MVWCERVNIVRLHIRGNSEGELRVIVVPLVARRQHRRERTVIHIHKVQGLVDQARYTCIGVAVIGVKTGLGEIIGLGSNFENVLDIGLVILSATTATGRAYERKNDQKGEYRGGRLDFHP